MNKIFFFTLLCFTIHGASAQVSWNINLMGTWSDSTLPASTDHNNTYNEVWGFEKDGKEYAVIGSTMGTHIIDVSLPSSISEVDFIPGAAQGTEIIHRDFHSYKNYLYMVCDEGQSTFQIVDLSYLPDSVHLIYDSQNLLIQSHNIFIDTSTAKLYACNNAFSNNTKAGMSVFSLANPSNPVLLNNYDGIGDVHDVHVKNDTAFCNAGMNGLFVVDFTNTSSPQIINSLTAYPDQHYNHSGWPTENGNYYFFADERWGRKMKSIDVSNLNNIQVRAVFGSNVDTLSVPHNQMVKGNYLFVSYYHDGLRIFDIHDPDNPKLTGYYNTSTEPHAQNFRGAWGVYTFLPSGKILVSDMQNGLFVLNADNATGVDYSTEKDPTKKIKCWPVPFSEELRFSPEFELQYTEISLFNGKGQLLKKKKYNTLMKNDTYSIKTKDLKAGIYFLKTVSGKFSYTRKIIKTR